MPAVIHSIGTYLPHFRIRADIIAQAWKRDVKQVKALGIVEKTVNSSDEDACTMAWEASRKAIEESGIEPKEIEAVYVGSESHPYAVKPTSGMVAQMLNVNPYCRCADLEFACKAGTAAMQIVASMVESKAITYGLAIGSDTAQAKPGDMLEYTAAAGAAAILIGPKSAKKPGLCTIDATLSYTTDTPDFWRNAEEKFPKHAGRFTGEPAYFHHVETAAEALMKKTKLKAADIDHVVFHMPNAKFPVQAASKLGFTKEQMKLGFIVPTIGNTYSACSLLGLASISEHAKKGEKILMVSYGSGAGADAFLFTMQRDGVEKKARNEPQHLTYDEYLQKKELVLA